MSSPIILNMQECRTNKNTCSREVEPLMNTLVYNPWVESLVHNPWVESLVYNPWVESVVYYPQIESLVYNAGLSLCFS